MTDYKKYVNALRKCAKEHENDKTFTGHIIVSDLCRDTANLLETLEQETVLDKIRAEVIAESYPEDEESSFCKIVYLKDVLDIIDKHKEESEKTHE